MKLTERITRAFKSATQPVKDVGVAVRAAWRAMQAFDAACQRLAAITVNTHGYCTKCSVWLRLDVAQGRCTVCRGKLTPME